MSQPEFSVQEGFFVAELDQRGISRGLYTAVTYDVAADYVSDILRNILDNGNITLSNVQEGGKYRFGDGTVSAPAISWAQDTDTGRYRIGAGNIGESIDGTLVKDWNASRLLLGSLDLLWNADNAEDIGAASANRPRTLYTGTDVIAGDKLKWKDATSFHGILDHAHSADRTHSFPNLDGTLVQYTTASVAIGDLLYWNSGPNWALLPDVATGNVLISGGVGAAPSYGKVGLTTHVSGTLPIGNGGTGQTTATAAFDALAPTTTQGDIIFYNGTDNVRLAAGTLGQVLISNGAGTNPTWATPTASATQAQQETASELNAFVSPGRQQYHPSAAKGWARVTVSGGTPTLQASYNITSITDTATGRLTVNWNTDFSSANYAIAACCAFTAGPDGIFRSPIAETAGFAAGSTLLSCVDQGGTAEVDPREWYIVAFGDQ